MTTATATLTISLPSGIPAKYILKVSHGSRGHERMMNEHRAFLRAHIALGKLYPGGPNPKPLGWGTYQSHQDVHFLLVKAAVEEGEGRVKKMKGKEEMGVEKGTEKEETGWRRGRERGRKRGWRRGIGREGEAPCLMTRGSRCTPRACGGIRRRQGRGRAVDGAG